MDTDARGQLGGMEVAEGVRRRLAGESRAWKCAGCGRGNEEVMREQEEAVGKDEGGKKEEEVPEQLRLAFREDLAKGAEGKAKVEDGANAASSEDGVSKAPVSASTPKSAPVAVPQPSSPAAPQTAPTPTVQVQQRRPAAAAQVEEIPAWIDKAIIGFVFAIGTVLWLRFFG